MYWLKKIPYKFIHLYKLNDDFQLIFNNINSTLNYLFVFDIEFQTFNNTKYILELGGILFKKINNIWYFYSNFHFNCPPITNIKSLNIINSKYITVSKKIKKKIKKLENKFLIHKKLEKYKNDHDKFFKFYNKHKYLKISNENNIDHIIKCYKNKSFNLKKHHIGSFYFNKIWSLYLNDKYVKLRSIHINYKFLSSFSSFLNKSFFIVKGNMDILSINNLFTKYKINKLSNINYHDISKYNNQFFKLCNSAKLDDTYNYIINNNLLNNIYKKDLYFILNTLVLNNNKKLISHNPLIDSYYTLIIFLSMYK